MNYIGDRTYQNHLHYLAGPGGGAMGSVTNAATENLFLEIIRIRNKAIHMLLVKHGLNLSQVMELTLSDIDLSEKMLAIKPCLTTNPGNLTITSATAIALADYLRVRSPTKESKLFLVEQNLDRSSALHCTIGHQVFVK